MSKTPFEIRLELLRMAKEMLEADYFSTKDKLQNEWQIKVSRANETNEPLPQYPIIPPFPTATEVIGKAMTLNIFVSNGTADV